MSIEDDGNAEKQKQLEQQRMAAEDAEQKEALKDAIKEINTPLGNLEKKGDASNGATERRQDPIVVYLSHRLDSRQPDRATEYRQDTVREYQGLQSQQEFQDKCQEYQNQADFLEAGQQGKITYTELGVPRQLDVPEIHTPKDASPEVALGVGTVVITEALAHGVAKAIRSGLEEIKGVSETIKDKIEEAREYTRKEMQEWRENLQGGDYNTKETEFEKIAKEYEETVFQCKVEELLNKVQTETPQELEQKSVVEAQDSATESENDKLDLGQEETRIREEALERERKRNS